ncbi:hypothetical protein SCP_1602280 [Sparassis crispa]|uniref:Uncharacterized protein n=1 Tax=Sparassis crispa TaxID=139825 RepID=A0A401H543_9APHY|nr:hypothetical protein SCP_1602280 [Sparassis crispa]GBE89566.1 hypothetical protein SCP_1602280 [Sparassis crispa]
MVHYQKMHVVQAIHTRVVQDMLGGLLVCGLAVTVLMRHSGAIQPNWAPYAIEA